MAQAINELILLVVLLLLEQSQLTIKNFAFVFLRSIALLSIGSCVAVFTVIFHHDADEAVSSDGKRHAFERDQANAS